MHVSFNFILLYTVGLFFAKKQRLVAIIGFKLRSLTYNVSSALVNRFTADLVGYLSQCFK